MLQRENADPFYTICTRSYPWQHQNKMPKQPAQMKISPAAGHFALLQNQAPEERIEKSEYSVMTMQSKGIQFEVKMTTFILLPKTQRSEEAGHFIFIATKLTGNTFATVCKCIYH